MLVVTLTQVEYDGHKQTHTERGDIAKTTIAASNNFYAAKEEQRRHVDHLLPDFIYTFNISAKFLDGTFGPSTMLRIETSPGLTDGLRLRHFDLPWPRCTASGATC